VGREHQRAIGDWGLLLLFATGAGEQRHGLGESFGRRSSLASAERRRKALWVGDNYYGQLGLGNKDNYILPQLISAGWTAISARNEFHLGIKSTERFGHGGIIHFGQLGLGHDERIIPTQVGSENGWVPSQPEMGFPWD